MTDHINTTDETLEAAEANMPVTADDVETEFGGDEPINSTLAAAMAAEVGGEPEVTKEKTQVGPKDIFEKDGALEAALLAIYAGAPQEGEEMPSRFIEKRLEEAGLVCFEPVKTGKAGRPRLVAYLTGAGLNQIGLEA